MPDTFASQITFSLLLSRSIAIHRAWVGLSSGQLQCWSIKLIYIHGGNGAVVYSVEITTSCPSASGHSPWTWQTLAGTCPWTRSDSFPRCICRMPTPVLEWLENTSDHVREHCLSDPFYWSPLAPRASRSRSPLDPYSFRSPLILTTVEQAAVDWPSFLMGETRAALVIAGGQWSNSCADFRRSKSGELWDNLSSSCIWWAIVKRYSGLLGGVERASRCSPEDWLTVYILRSKSETPRTFLVQYWKWSVVPKVECLVGSCYTHLPLLNV